MKKELFGVFGDRETFDQIRSPIEFDEIVDGNGATVGIRDPGLGTPGWTARHTSNDGACVIWGEAYAPTPNESNPARWLLERYLNVGLDAFSALNGSYVVVVWVDGDVFVVTDPIRSWECFYTDDPKVRVFGTDSVEVARTIRSPRINTDGILEYLHLGVTLGEKTSIEQMSRLPMDSYLTLRSVGHLNRFIYTPKEFDYATELAERLRRAIQRRAILPGRKGLLLSAGYDSRTLLSQLPTIDRCFTVGTPGSQEVTGAIRLAEQYNTNHTTLTPDRRYLLADAEKVRYSQGIKESLHIHHAGYTDEMKVDTMYHGLLCDTFFRGHFSANDHIDILGYRIPRSKLDPDPNPVESLLSKFGYDIEASRRLSSHTALTVDSDAFVRDAVAVEFEKTRNRADSIQNALNACGIGNQPSMPFHFQLADNFFESFLALDAELIDWHLTTPPEYRTTETFLKACALLDSELLRFRPPDRPQHSPVLNQIERFIRRKTPFLQPFEPTWPNYNLVFDRYDLDQLLLSELDHVHDPLPARHKLRLNDIIRWMEQCSPSSAQSTVRLFRPVVTA